MVLESGLGLELTLMLECGWELFGEYEPALKVLKAE